MKHYRYQSDKQMMAFWIMLAFVAIITYFILRYINHIDKAIGLHESVETTLAVTAAILVLSIRYGGKVVRFLKAWIKAIIYIKKNNL